MRLKKPSRLIYEAIENRQTIGDDTGNHMVTGQWEATLLNWVLMEVFPLNNMITSTLYKVSEKRLYIWLSLYAITDIHESLS